MTPRPADANLAPATPAASPELGGRERRLRVPKPPPRGSGPRILMVAGENSGDNHAAELAKALLKRLPDAQLYGLGGERMARAGVAPLTNIAQNLAIIGLWGVIRHYGVLRGLLRSAYEALERDRPDAVILIDYPGFNQRVAERASELGIPVVYYVCPQFWAWNGRRKWKLARIVDLMMVIFRFEEGLCRSVGINARHVGHPLLDTLRVTKTREQVCRENGLDPNRKIIGLLPGSRKSEVSRLLPPMLEGAERMMESEPGAQFVLIQADTIPDALIDERLRGCRAPVSIIRRDRVNVRAAMDFAWVASGTATLETAVLGTPHIIIYSTNFLTWVIGQRLVQTPYIGLVNIVAEDRVVPELLQDQATGQNIHDTTLAHFNDPQKMEEVRRGLDRVRRVMGKQGAAKRAAALVDRFLQELETKPKERVKSEMLQTPVPEAFAGPEMVQEVG
jgi:lipid-A-disaccharide synthase